MKNRFYLITAVILLLPCTLRAQWSVGLLGAQHGTEFNSSSVKVFEFSRKVDFNTEKDNRLDLGLAGGLGLEYGISRHWAVQLEARGYYSLASQVKQYMQVKDYRYDTTVVLQAACLEGVLRAHPDLDQDLPGPAITGSISA